MSTSNPLAAPLSLTPSGTWETTFDGVWSSFWLQAGTPPQTFRVLPGTSVRPSAATWLMDPGACVSPFNVSSQDSCPNDRGGIFTYSNNASSTYDPLVKGNTTVYALSADLETDLGRGGGFGRYAFETVTFGRGVGKFPVTNKVPIATIISPDYYVGMLGLSPNPISIQALSVQYPSLLNLLVSQGSVPSTVWSYTAGAAYKNPQVLGSLTLGGYDSTRFVANNVSFPISSDGIRDLVVNVNSITYNGSSATNTLTSQPIQVFLDSLVPEIWLPTSACQAFEQQFGLSWNSTYSRYFLNSTTYNSLKASNPTFRFNISGVEAGSSSGRSVQIAIPYAAFDLNYRSPPAINSVRYFPLRRAPSDSQATFGRVFLQEAYVIADYDRKNFSVSQALFPASSQPSNIVAIRVPSVNPSPSPASSSSSDGLSGGAIAGIVIGAILLLLIAAGGIFWRRRRQHKKRKTETETRVATVVAAVEAEKSEKQAINPYFPSNDPSAHYNNNPGQSSDRPANSPPPTYIDEQHKTPIELDALHEAGQRSPASTGMGISAMTSSAVPRAGTHELAGAQPPVGELDSPRYEMPSPGSEPMVGPHR